MNSKSLHIIRPSLWLLFLNKSLVCVGAFDRGEKKANINIGLEFHNVVEYPEDITFEMIHIATRNSDWEIVLMWVMGGQVGDKSNGGD